jgi:hypothetical protein
MAGKPQASVFLVNPVLVMQPGMEQSFTLRELLAELRSSEEGAELGAKLGLLPNFRRCDRCTEEMRVTRPRGKEPFWRCPNCRARSSVRSVDGGGGTFFSGAKVGVGLALELGYWWSLNVKIATVIEQTGVVRSETVTDWNSYWRELCGNYSHRQPPIGGRAADGSRIIVELDETVFVRRKYHRGRVLRNSFWIFGGVERGNSSRFFYVRVAQRSATVLLPLIRKFVAPGSRVMTDGWAAYGGIGRMIGCDYEHCVVIHEHEFVHQVDRSIHTQTIESTWNSLKSQLKSMRGSKETLVAEYLDEFLFRRRHGHSAKAIFTALLSEIRLKYPV